MISNWKYALGIYIKTNVLTEEDNHQIHPPMASIRIQVLRPESGMLLLRRRRIETQSRSLHHLRICRRKERSPHKRNNRETKRPPNTDRNK